MRQDIQILPDNRLFPTVMNINQGQNKIETALYSMENYVVNEVDLSTCDWYAVLMGVYGLDEVKLTHEVDEGVLKVRWNLNDYVTNIGQTLTYQIVAKNSEAAVYYTNKGIILNSQSIHADEFIVSNYPSILRQWEEYMKDLGDSANLKAYVVMDVDNYIPVHERVEGKFYINRLTDYDYSCLIEDSDGNVITPSARGISYDPTKTGILANNVQDAIDNLGRKINGLNRFCVNEGNLTDGVEDLLEFSDSTLSFKVGGSYPNVIVTKADGTTFTRGSIDQSYVSDLDDGVYNVFIDETNVELLNNTIISQGQEDLAVQNDVLYNTVTFECKKYLQSGDTVTIIDSPTSELITDVTSNGQIYVAVGGQANALILTSIDGVNWGLQNIPSSSPLKQVIYTGKSFIAVGNNATILRSIDGVNWTKITLGNGSYINPILSIATNGSRIIVGGASMQTFYSDDDGITWQTGSKLSNTYSDYVRSLAYGNNTFIACDSLGHYYTSTDNGINWSEHTLGDSVVMNRVRFVNGMFLALSNNGLVWSSSNGSSLQQNYVGERISIVDISFYKNKYYYITTSGDIGVSDNLSTWEQLQESGKPLSSIYENIIVGNLGTILNLETVTWQNYSKVPVGSVVVSNGVITYVETFPYNYTQYNGLIATPTTFGVMRVAAPTDEIDCSCNDASITPANLYDLSNYRRANTEYAVGDTVACPYHHDIFLSCTTAGTTSNESLDTRGTLNVGETIIDGTVVWMIQTTDTSNFLNKQQITNCITEIPQDIKLELADGTLTLKAGSKVYVPNGFEADGTTPKFDIATNDNDITIGTSGSSSEGPQKIFCGIIGNSISQITWDINTESGTSSTATQSYTVYYNTSTNRVGQASGSTTINYTDLFSFPIAICTNLANKTGWKSIDQVFNGFGYIGSTVFALPGVKGLIPDGRNADGSLRNIEFVIEKVKTNTNTTSNDNQWIFYDGYNLQDRAMVNARYYDENENKWYISNGYYSYCHLFTIKRAVGAITSFTPKQPFHAVDRNDAALKQNFQVVSTLPSSPNADTFYFIPE